MEIIAVNLFVYFLTIYFAKHIYYMTYKICECVYVYLFIYMYIYKYTYAIFGS